MLQGILRSLFGSPQPPPATFHDPLLGDLKLGRMGWTVKISKGADSFEFTIGGNVIQPNPAVLSHAHEILDDFESFKNAVRDYIDLESRDYPPDVKAELAHLEVDSISLHWPDRPN